MNIDKGQKMTITAPDGRSVPVRFEVNNKAKRLILRLDQMKREAVAVAPSRKMLGEAANFAKEKASWIADQLSSVPENIPFIPGSVIPFRGTDLHLSIDGKGRLARLEDRGGVQTLVAPGMLETFRGRVVRFLKKSATEDLTFYVDHHCQLLNVHARRISVKDTKSRWGSCTSDGQLSFSWRLVCAPPDVLNYVAAHECAHLLEMNHSKRFWAHVERCMPDWKLYRFWLDKYGAELHALGGEDQSSSEPFASVAEASAAR